MAERDPREIEDREDLLAPPDRDGGPAPDPTPPLHPAEGAADRAAGALPQSPAPAAPGSEGLLLQGADGIHLPHSLRAPTRRRVQEAAISGVLFLASAISVLTTVGIIGVLLYESSGFFSDVSPVEFLTGTRWAPLFRPQAFGVLPLLAGSFLVATGAAVVALPIGVASAIYLSEYAPARARAILKPALEVLAGVPTVVYGFFALTFVTPILQGIWPTTQIFNAMSASIVVGIMIIPLVASLAEDAMTAVPNSLREGAYALGATKLEVSVRTVLPAALSGIVASFILAISRAIGETMIVAIAAGAGSKLTFNPFEGAETMTGHIARISGGDISYGSIDYSSLYAIGLTLFVMTLSLNFLSQRIVRRFREVYE